MRRRAVRVADDAALALGAEADRAAVLEADLVRLLALGADGVEGAVVEDVAVLVDLDQRRSLVVRRGAQHLRLVVAVRVHRPRDEARLGAERQGDRVEGVVQGPERRRLGDLALLAGRRVLPLGQTVDLVVEEEDLDRDVAAQRVDQVVAADREGVAVAAHHPDREVRAREREPGGERGRAAVDAVDAVGVHVVGEAAGAADPRDEDDPLRGQPKLGQELLDGGEDRVVAAARGTSASPGRRRSPSWSARWGGAVAVAVRVRHRRSVITSSSSSAKIGRPSTLL